mmetsp:Transcript_39472/g.126532  ORF Transcript_39472/g.126532 Transcript_39472/m.126532 type:complete len:287 (-) Transcript_39472:710-1570(-)
MCIGSSSAAGRASPCTELYHHLAAAGLAATRKAGALPLALQNVQRHLHEPETLGRQQRSAGHSTWGGQRCGNCACEVLGRVREHQQWRYLATDCVAEGLPSPEAALLSVRPRQTCGTLLASRRYERNPQGIQVSQSKSDLHLRKQSGRPQQLREVRLWCAGTPNVKSCGLVLLSGREQRNQSRNRLSDVLCPAHGKTQRLAKLVGIARRLAQFFVPSFAPICIRSAYATSPGVSQDLPRLLRQRGHRQQRPAALARRCLDLGYSHRDTTQHPGRVLQRQRLLVRQP